MIKHTKFIFGFVTIATILACSGSDGPSHTGDVGSVAFTNACVSCGGVDVSLIDTTTNRSYLIAQGFEAGDNSNPGDTKVLPVGSYRYRVTQHGTTNVIDEPPAAENISHVRLDGGSDRLLVFTGSLTTHSMLNENRQREGDVSMLIAAPDVQDVQVHFTAPDATLTNSANVHDYRSTHLWSGIGDPWRIRVTPAGDVTTILADTGSQSGDAYMVLEPTGVASGLRFVRIAEAH